MCSKMEKKSDFFGMPRKLTYGFLGVLIFMMGDGLEQTWLSRYITEAGLDAATLFSLYGLMVGISAWLSGVIAETFGVKKTMLAGFALYVAGVAGFAGIGMPRMDYSVLLATYAIKGFGYPLFAYTLMVWITYRVEQKTLSSAQGWFWFVFTGGLNVLGAYLGIFSKENIGVIPTLWTEMIFAALGAIFALWVNKCPDDNLFADTSKQKGSHLREFIRGLSIIGREPKVLIGGIVRIINTSSQFAFVVFMPLYMVKYGVTDADWATIWAGIFIFNIVFNLIFGIVGDKIGWNRTVTIFGCLGCAVGTLLFFYSPQIINNYWFILACGAFWCISLAGFVPLSALVPSLVRSDKGAAISVLNLGAGGAGFLGPLIVKMFATEGAADPYNYVPIAWTLAGLYILSAVLMFFLRSPRKAD